MVRHQVTKNQQIEITVKKYQFTGYRFTKTSIIADVGINCAAENYFKKLLFSSKQQQRNNNNNSRELNTIPLGEPPVFFALLHLGEAFFLIALVVARNLCIFSDPLAIMFNFGEPFPTIVIKYDTSLFTYYKLIQLLQAKFITSLFMTKAYYNLFKD